MLAIYMAKLPYRAMLHILRLILSLPIVDENEMKPPKEFINKFKKLILQEFNEELRDDEAYEKFDRLDSVLRVVFKVKLDRTKDGDILGPVNQ